MRIRSLLLIFCVLSFSILIAQEDKKWDSSQHHIPADTMEFETSEGTWMNLDVSLDGKQIVFDMLGDIFIMPVKGGEATLLSGGLPYEVQPRFSPNGKMISFTSDRAGADNIWTMNVDGSDKKQVTKEDFRLLNNAIWSNDGNYLIARKHFTSRRSLGAGEMWMYHLSGGKGLQLTKRKNDQQDVNEPNLSPDGKYLYFCEDMYPGGKFQYDKNVHKRIYAVRRLDMNTGKVKNIISINGGSVRPTVSPDGKSIAFVRRVRTKTVLNIYNIASGEITPIYDGLTQDQQEAWAVFGLYPNFDWMPNGKSIVFWSNGKIHSINVKTRKVTEIPFKVTQKQSIAKALRFKQKVFEDNFESKMIRHATTSPDGKTIVFNALGQLWKKKLPNGKPSRLTKSTEREFEPSFSPDGKWIVYTTWEDAKQGTISKVKIGGGKVYRITKKPGYYHSPKFSPNGKLLIYDRWNGDSILGYANGTESAIYTCTSGGNNHKSVVESGLNPTFSKDNKRIYIVKYDGEGRTLKSFDINGKDEKTLFTSKYATNFVVSPDEKWVAFKELFHLYIVPFPKTGKAIDLSGEMGSLPIKKVTRDAGRDVHWSKDSKNLHWLIGPEYFTRSISNSFTFVHGAPDSLPAIDSTGIKINLHAKN